MKSTQGVLLAGGGNCDTCVGLKIQPLNTMKNSIVKQKFSTNGDCFQWTVTRRASAVLPGCTDNSPYFCKFEVCLSPDISSIGLESQLLGYQAMM